MAVVAIVALIAMHVLLAQRGIRTYASAGKMIVRVSPYPTVAEESVEILYLQAMRDPGQTEQ